MQKKQRTKEKLTDSFGMCISFLPHLGIGEGIAQSQGPTDTRIQATKDIQIARGTAHICPLNPPSVFIASIRVCH